ELLRTGPYVCIDGIDIKVDKFGREHITYRFANRDKALQQLKDYILSPRQPRQGFGGVAINTSGGNAGVFVLQKETLASWQAKFGAPNPNES
ncbi:MAG: hypothetical protein LLF89_09085, partial [Spirochaetaceae bacterium]|nr:hypothetical protein [Spirochaetaceae bacterium]